MYKEKTVCVVVPCYNEETQVEQVIKTMPEYVDQVIVVDDMSSDGTNLWVALEFNAKLNNWSGLNSSSNTAMVIQFDQSLHPLQSFFIDENGTGGFQSAAANAISILNNEMYDVKSVTSAEQS